MNKKKPWISRKSALGLVAVCTLLGGCMSAPTVYSGNTIKAQPGSFSKLQDLLGGNRQLRLVIVHGVGDHCPGFAIGNDNDAWLNRNALNYLHMRAIDDIVSQHIPATLILPNAEPTSEVVMSKRHYRLSPSGPTGTSTIDVEAIELTWSGLTRWIKRQQLGQDFTAPPTTQCKGDHFPVAQGLTPPAREWLNKDIKEVVLDLSLSDAMLYVGVYGHLMEQGLAEALCHGVTETPATQRCEWPKIGRAHV